MSRTARILVIALAACTVSALGAWALAPGPATPDPRVSPAPPQRGFEPAADAEGLRPLRRGETLAARLRAPTLLRTRPGGRGGVRIGRRTEFGSLRQLAVIGRREGWLRVMAPEAPSGRGWIVARRAELVAIGWSIEIDRSRMRMIVRRRGEVRWRTRVAVGRSQTPTPLGRFAVTDTLRVEDPGSPYGCCAIALSARQRYLAPGWAGGDRVAIHATTNTASIGTPASLGCVRAPSALMRRLLDVIPPGTPVTIRA